MVVKVNTKIAKIRRISSTFNFWISAWFLSKNFNFFSDYYYFLPSITHMKSMSYDLLTNIYNSSYAIN